MKEFEGKRKQYGGSLNPSGTSSWEYVVPNGKTFWMYYYALTATDDDESNKRQDMVLSGDGTSIVSIEGRHAQHGQSRSTSNTMSLTGSLPRKFEGDGSKALRVEVSSTAGVWSQNFAIQGFLEDTGVSPKI